MGIGERIRRRRVELGFTRNELAEKVHVTLLLQIMRITSVFLSWSC